MIVSIDWLQDLIPFRGKPAKIADQLTALGLESTVGANEMTLEIELTPNRPDCMSHLGIAREIALFSGETIKYPENRLKESSIHTSDEVAINIIDKYECPRYAARVIKGIKVEPSPEWVINRLEQCGIRSINNVVDISNYVLLELGHPLHIFDLNLLASKTLNIRLANNGETITTLDGEKRILSEHNLIISDTKNPVALAGIIGGENTEVNEATTDILIECAYFNPITIRRGTKDFGISTEASKRFERGVDHNDMHAVLDRTAKLILEVASGECCVDVLDCYEKEIKTTEITFLPSKTNKVLGVDLNNEFISLTLNNLGIEHSISDNSYICSIPTYRPDLERPIDIIEELGRVYGFDRIKSKNSYVGNLASVKKDDDIYIDSLRNHFKGIGFNEIMTNSLINSTDASVFSSNVVTVSNPLSREMSVLRPSLLPGLLGSVCYNIRRGEVDLALFETGKVFTSHDKGWKENQAFSGIVTGNRLRKGWRNDSQIFDIFVIKGIIDDLAKNLGISASFHSYPDYYYSPGLSLNSSDGVVSTFGNLKSSILAHYELDSPVLIFDLNLDIIKIDKGVTKFEKLPDFPGITRDLSFAIPSAISISDLDDIIHNKGGDLLRSVKLYDLYDGDQIEEGYKSVTFSLSFRSNKRTLEDKEVDSIIDEIISKISNTLGAKLR